VTLVHAGNWVNAAAIGDDTGARCSLCHGRLNEGGWLNVTLEATACRRCLRDPDVDGERVTARLLARREADERRARKAWPFERGRDGVADTSERALLDSYE
jgi:hypothetical protein